MAHHATPRQRPPSLLFVANVQEAEKITILLHAIDREGRGMNCNHLILYLAPCSVVAQVFNSIEVASVLPYSNECLRSEYLPKGKRRATASPSYVFADPGARLKLLEELLLISFVNRDHGRGGRLVLSKSVPLLDKLRVVGADTEWGHAAAWGRQVGGLRQAGRPTDRDRGVDCHKTDMDSLRRCSELRPTEGVTLRRASAANLRSASERRRRRS